MKKLRLSAPHDYHFDQDYDPLLYSVLAGQWDSSLPSLNFSCDAFVPLPASGGIDSNLFLSSFLSDDFGLTTWDDRGSPTLSSSQEPGEYLATLLPAAVMLETAANPVANATDPPPNDTLFGHTSTSELTEYAAMSQADVERQYKRFSQHSKLRRWNDQNESNILSKTRTPRRATLIKRCSQSPHSVSTNNQESNRPARPPSSTHKDGTCGTAARLQASTRTRKTHLVEDVDDGHNNRASHNLVEKNYRHRLNCSFKSLLAVVKSTTSADERHDAHAEGDSLRSLSKSDVLNLARQTLLDLGSENQRLRSLL